MRGEGVTGVSWEAKSGRTFPAILPGKPLVLDNIDLNAGDEYRCVVRTQEGDRVVSQYGRVAIYGKAMLLHVSGTVFGCYCSMHLSMYMSYINLCLHLNASGV